MSNTVKVLLIIGAVIIGLVTCCCAGGGMWFAANKERLMAAGDRAEREAEAFAADHDAPACLEESFRRYRLDPGLGSEIATKIFMTRCLEVAVTPPDFCDGVPGPMDIMEGVSWRLRKCATIGALPDPQACGRMLDTVPAFCEQYRAGAFAGSDDDTVSEEDESVAPGPPDPAVAPEPAVGEVPPAK
jgi:hypothetical protein